ncbi:antitoxin Xre/MbcA/ParS toxin-binding domain-containing protein [Novosphingobium sp. PS1R-30]|uniref:Antitoxin Xre/MbcA/ParS toxin-binding domain-containing protein n=1 Tax=Novosphingobium anseongense TaxID=3133436 RepID=A0ABU8S170_9SPHN
MRFRRSGDKLPADAARRQGEVTHLAFLALGGRDAAVEFLNLPDADLGGRPLDVALASAEGAARVTQAIKRLAGARTQ